MEQPVTVGRAGRSLGEPPEALAALVGEALTARVTLDEHGTVTGWNAGAEQLLGYASGQMTGHPAADLLAEPIPVRGGSPLSPDCLAGTATSRSGTATAGS